MDEKELKINSIFTEIGLNQSNESFQEVFYFNFFE